MMLPIVGGGAGGLTWESCHDTRPAPRGLTCVGHPGALASTARLSTNISTPASSRPTTVRAVPGRRYWMLITLFNASAWRPTLTCLPGACCASRGGSVMRAATARSPSSCGTSGLSPPSGSSAGSKLDDDAALSFAEEGLPPRLETHPALFRK